MYVMVALPWSFNDFKFKDCRRFLLMSDFARDGAMSIGKMSIGKRWK